MKYEAKYFKEKEFRSPDEDHILVNVDDDFLRMLDNARAIYGKPVTINSGYRTTEHNAAVFGKSNSAHLLQPVVAADLRVPTALLYHELQEGKNSRERFEILKGSAEKGSFIESLLCEGITRFGISRYNWIHTDYDQTKAQQVVWLYT